MAAMIPDPSPIESEEESRPLLLVYLLYAAAVMVSAVVAFGAPGVIPGLFVVGSWWYVYESRSRPRALLFVSVFFCLVTMFLLLPVVGDARVAARRTQCRNNIKQIMLALHNYHDVYHTFPPAYVTDRDGRPMHSWRVLILPHLDQQSLYKEYDLDEPWDGPHNHELISRMPQVYGCPNVNEEGFTSYVAVVGSHTCWPDAQGAAIRQIVDGTSNTIALIEWNPSDIHWTEPRDPDLKEAVRRMSSHDMREAGGHRHESYLYEYMTGRHVAFADGSARYVSNGIDADVVSAMLVVDDGVTDWDLTPSRVTEYKALKVGNLLRLVTFLLLAVFPFPWVWLNPTGPRGRANAVAITLSE